MHHEESRGDTARTPSPQVGTDGSGQSSTHGHSRGLPLFRPPQPQHPAGQIETVDFYAGHIGRPHSQVHHAEYNRLIAQADRRCGINGTDQAFQVFAEAGVRQSFARHPYEARICETFRNGKSVYALGSPPVLIDRDSTRPVPLGGEALAVTRYWERMAVGAGDGIIRIWNLDEARIEKTLRLDDCPAETFRAAAAGSWARRANPNQIWDLLHWLVWLRADVALLPEDALTRFGGSGREKTADDAMDNHRVTKSNTVRQVMLAVSGPRKVVVGEKVDLTITLSGCP